MAPANEFIDANIVNEEKKDPSSGLGCVCIEVVAIAFQLEPMLLLILILLFTRSVSSICWNTMWRNAQKCSLKLVHE